MSRYGFPLEFAQGIVNEALILSSAWYGGACL
jgi:hypothetical protein